MLRYLAEEDANGGGVELPGTASTTTADPEVAAHDAEEVVRGSASFDSLAVSEDSEFAGEDSPYISENSVFAGEDAMPVRQEGRKKAVPTKCARKPPRMPGPVPARVGNDQSRFDGRWERCSPKGRTGAWLDHLTIHGALVVDGVGKAHVLRQGPQGPWLCLGWLKIKGDLLFRLGVMGSVQVYARAA